MTYSGDKQGYTEETELLKVKRRFKGKKVKG